MKKNRFITKLLKALDEMIEQYMYLEAYEFAINLRDSYMHIDNLDQKIEFLKPLLCFDVEKKKLCKYTGSEQIVVVPDGIEAIGYKCFNSNDTVTKIVLPDSVIKIDDDAFFNCSNLKSIKFPESYLKKFN